MTNSNIEQIVDNLICNWTKIPSESQIIFPIMSTIFLQIPDYNNLTHIPIYNLSVELLHNIKDVNTLKAQNIRLTEFRTSSITGFVKICREWANMRSGLCLVKLNQEVFYIFRGGLFDKDFNLLFIMSYSISKKRYRSKTFFIATNPTLHVDYKFFNYKKFAGYFNKYFINSCNKTYSSIDINNPHVRKLTDIHEKVEIQIHDLDKFFIKLNVIPFDTNLTTDLNQLFSKDLKLPEFI